MPINTPAADIVQQLRRVGLRPPVTLVERILEQPEAAIFPLLELALDAELLLEEPPKRWAPVHALRLLGELGSTEIIAPLLGAFPLAFEGPEDEAPNMWATEAPQIIGRLGEAATETLWAWIDDAQRHLIARAAAIESLPFTTAVAPELRDAIIDGFRSRLIEEEDQKLATLFVNALGRLGAANAYGDVMAAYRAGRIDTEMLPAASARQLLLGGGTSSLACAAHPLWERYDDHGPHEAVAAR